MSGRGEGAVKSNQRRRKRGALGCLLCSAVLALTGCGGGVPLRDETETTLPPATVTETAPIGDAALEYTADRTLFLPRYDGTSLISLTDAVSCSAARLDEESVIRALLAHDGTGVADSLGGDVQLSLYGANPVEVSGNVATVNLAASALQLDRKTLYLCGQAMANTLTEFSNIHYVNILVMDKQIGLDLASTLPTGALARSVVSDVGAAYEQALSQRVDTGEDPANKRLNATVALYFPLSAVNGVMSEARNISFSSQAPADMVTRLLEELAEGPVTVSGSPTLPLLAGLLTAAPEVTEAAEGGGKLVTLRFDSTMDDMLATAGVSRASCMCSLCYTLCTFLPNVTGITAYIGNERVDHVMLGATTGLLFDEGVQRRADYAQLLMDDCTLYLANGEGTALEAVRRPVPFYQRTNPRVLLLELFSGPSAEDGAQGTQAVLPAELMTDADILGLALNGDTLLVNLSSVFGNAGEGMTAQQDRLLAYAMVNTLLSDGRASRVCFFVNGETPSDLTGEIYWAGYFYRNLGFVRTQE